MHEQSDEIKQVCTSCKQKLFCVIDVKITKTLFAFKEFFEIKGAFFEMIEEHRNNEVQNWQKGKHCDLVEIEWD